MGCQSRTASECSKVLLGWRIDRIRAGADRTASCAREAALFVRSLMKTADRALLSAEGYTVEWALAVLDQWSMEDTANSAAT